MKVLLFSTQWPEYMIALANAMSKKADTLLMLPHNYGIQQAHIDCINPNVRFITFKAIDFKSIRHNFRMLLHILRVVWTERPDILHIQANGHRLFFYVAIFKPFKTKIVNTIHDPEKHIGDLSSINSDYSWVTYLLRFFTEKYIVHGVRLVEHLARAYSINQNRIVSIPHGHFEIYKKLQINTATTANSFVLFFGRIWEYKGLSYFIEAANIVHQKLPAVKFCIAGRGEELDTYLGLINNRDSFIIINKRIPIGEVGALFEAASMVVLPYIEATQSGVIPVAYAYSKPVIASAVGGLPEVVIDNETGFLVAPKCAQQIADKIIFLVQNPLERTEMGQRAYAYAMDVLSWERIAEATYNVYRDVK